MASVASVASSTPHAKVAPLEGVRVLDMTRVLAGVSRFPRIAFVCVFFRPLSGEIDAMRARK